MKKPAGSVRYKRSRFSTRLPEDNLYTSSHFWVQAAGEDTWKVGFTKFAVRMLGEIVEHGFEVKPATAIQVGQIIGWVEGFKALTDLYSVVDGEFEGGNPLLEKDCEKIYRDPYGEGWLYLATGKPDVNSVDVHGYVGILDETIDRIRGAQQSQEEPDSES